MTHYEPWEQGDQYGMRYLFDKAGDRIPMHSHADPILQHSTQCLKGSCAIYGDEINLVLHAGERAEFDSSREHEIQALEDGTEIINLFLLGKPASYAAADPENLKGTYA